MLTQLVLTETHFRNPTLTIWNLICNHMKTKWFWDCYWMVLLHFLNFHFSGFLCCIVDVIMLTPAWWRYQSNRPVQLVRSVDPRPSQLTRSPLRLGFKIEVGTTTSTHISKSVIHQGIIVGTYCPDAHPGIGGFSWWPNAISYQYSFHDDPTLNTTTNQTQTTSISMLDV